MSCLSNSSSSGCSHTLAHRYFLLSIPLFPPSNLPNTMECIEKAGMNSHYRYFIHKVICVIILGWCGGLTVLYILSTFGSIPEYVVPLFEYATSSRFWASCIILAHSFLSFIFKLGLYSFGHLKIFQTIKWQRWRMLTLESIQLHTVKRENAFHLDQKDFGPQSSFIWFSRGFW